MNVGLDSWLIAILLSVASRWSPICLLVGARCRVTLLMCSLLLLLSRVCEAACYTVMWTDFTDGLTSVEFVFRLERD